MTTVYVAHPDVYGGVETRLDGVRLSGTRGSSITMTVPPDVYRTLNAIVPGPRTSLLTLRIVLEADETIGDWVIAASKRLPGGWADLTLHATGAIRTENLGSRGLGRDSDSACFARLSHPARGDNTAVNNL